MKKFLKSKKINHSISTTNVKASLAERLNQTLKRKIIIYMFHNKTTKYYGILNDIINNYNQTEHSRTKFIPALVSKENEHQVFNNLYQNANNVIIKKRIYDLNEK